MYFFLSRQQESNRKKSKNLKKIRFKKICTSSITQQLFAKLLSHSSYTVGHHWKRIWKIFQ